MFVPNSWQSHSEYIATFKNAKAQFPSDLRMELFDRYSVVRRKLFSLDLDPIGEYVAQFYPPCGRPALHQAQILRSRQMERDYPDIIQKLILFLKAGLSIRKSMEKLAADYLKRKESALIGTRYAYEELVKTCLEMERGVYEKDAYERLGRRCGLAEYKILSVLLVQNLKKGNQSILDLLEREAVSAGEERLRRARIQGEEATTKLLLPMILQLLVLFIILMVPAFINFF